jgi:hypothetical protein
VAADTQLGRRLLPEEYQRALSAMRRLGFSNGWAQDFVSADFYNPDFNREDPFSG